MRKPGIGSLSLAVVGVALCAASATAQERALNRVADGDFESGVVSLSLPAAAQFPVFSGGWASRGAQPIEIVAGGSFAGARSLRIETRPEDAAQVLQDLALNDAAYGMRFAFFIEWGRQTIRLLSDWDRGVPDDGTSAFEAEISASGVRFTTPTGSWYVDTEISPFEWHSLSVIADPRSGTQDVRLDDRPLLSLPGVAFVRRSTLVLAGGIADRGAFRYDAIAVASLVELELAAIGDAVTMLDIPARAAVLRRLAAAAAALDRGSPALALPELGVARNMLGLGSSLTDARNTQQAISELMVLIEESGQLRPVR